MTMFTYIFETRFLIPTLTTGIEIIVSQELTVLVLTQHLTTLITSTSNGKIVHGMLSESAIVPDREDNNISIAAVNRSLVGHLSNST